MAKTKKLPLWKGLRFKALVRKLMKRWMSKESAVRLAAWIWIKKYWKKKMLQRAQKQRKLKSKNKK